VKKVAPKSVHFEGKKFWNRHIYSIGSSRLPNRAGLRNFTTFLSNMKPNLVNSLSGWSSIWLQHKIRRRKKQKPSSPYEALSWISNWLCHKIQMEDREVRNVKFSSQKSEFRHWSYANTSNKYWRKTPPKWVNILYNCIYVYFKNHNRNIIVWIVIKNIDLFFINYKIYMLETWHNSKMFLHV